MNRSFVLGTRSTVNRSLVLETRFTVCGTLLLAGLALLATLAPVAPASAQTPITEGVAAPPGTVVQLRLQSGSVVIHGWGRDSVHVQGELAPGESWENRLDGDTVRMRALGMPRGLAAPSELEIFLPRTSAVLIRAAAASMVVRDFDESVDVATAAGNLLVERVLGDVRAETMQGTLTVIGPVPHLDASTATGALLVSVPYDTLKNADGDITSIVPSALNGRAPFGEMVVRSVSGAITFDAPQFGQALVQNVRGDTRVIGAPVGGGALRVTSHVGLVTYRWRADRSTAATTAGATSGSADVQMTAVASVRLDALSQHGGLRGQVPATGAGAAVDVTTRVQRSVLGARVQQWLDGRPLAERPLAERPLAERPLAERPLAERSLTGSPLSTDSTVGGVGTVRLRNVRGDIVLESLVPRAATP